MFEAYNIYFVLVQLIGLRFLIRQTVLLGCKREPRVIDYLLFHELSFSQNFYSNYTTNFGLNFF